MNRIKELRLKNKATQKEVAEFVGISQQAYSKYEKNDGNLPHSKNAYLLAEYFNVPIAYLLGYEDYDFTFNFDGISENATYEENEDDLNRQQEIIYDEIIKPIQSKENFKKSEKLIIDIFHNKLSSVEKEKAFLDILQTILYAAREHEEYGRYIGNIMLAFEKINE